MGRLADLLREVESEAEEEPKAPEDARALFSKTFSKVCGPDAASLNSSQFVEVFQLLGIALDRVEAEELFEAFATIAATHTGPATISIEDAQRALAHCGAHDDGAVVRALRPHNLKRNQSGRKSSIIVYEANLDPDRGLQQSMGVSNIVSVCLDGLPEKGDKGPFGDQRWCVLLFLEGSEVDEWGQPVGATECSMATCTPVYIRCFLIGDKCKRRLKFQIANCKKDDNLVPVLSSCTAFAEATCTMEQVRKRCSLTPPSVFSFAPSTHAGVKHPRSKAYRIERACTRSTEFRSTTSLNWRCGARRSALRLFGVFLHAAQYPLPTVQLLTSPNMRLELGARVAPEFAALAPTPAQVNLFATQFAERVARPA